MRVMGTQELQAIGGLRPLQFSQALKLRFGRNVGIGFYSIALFILIIVCLIPIWSVDCPEITDFPNHLVRDYILAHYHENPLWQQRYALDGTPLPNLAIDLFVVPLLKLLPLFVCGKLFLSASAALYIIGCHETARALHGRPNWLALVGGLTFYNTELTKGLVNYVFGVSVFLCIFAFWFRVRTRMSPTTFLLCGLLSIAAYLSHLSSVVLLGLCCGSVAAFDFVRHRKLSKLVAEVAWLGFPLLLTFGFLHGSGRVGTIGWSLALKPKMMLLLSPFRSYSLYLTVGVALCCFLCFLILLLKCKVQPTCWVGVLLLLLFLVSPGKMFTATNVAERYLVPGCLMILLSIEPNWGRPQKVAFGVMLIALTARLGNFASSWRSFDLDARHIVAMGECLPQGAKVFVLPVMASRAAGGAGSAVPEERLLFMAQYWTLSRAADVSNLYALPGQQPLVFRQPACHGPYPAEPEWLACLDQFDFVWAVDPAPAYSKALSRAAVRIAVFESGTLWRVNRAPPRAEPSQ